MLKTEVKVTHLNLFSTLISYGVSTESGFKHSFCEMKVLIPVCEASEYPKFFCSLTPNMSDLVKHRVIWEIIRCRELFILTHLNLAILQSFLSEN